MPVFFQITTVPQNGNLDFFSALLKGLPDRIHRPRDRLKVSVDTDDLRGSSFPVRQTLHFAPSESALTIKLTKTEVIKFRER